MNEVYLVTGAAGHLGRTVIQDLLNNTNYFKIKKQLILKRGKYE